MVITISVTPTTEKRLREMAAAGSKSLDELVATLVEQSAARPSLDELLAPLRQQFAESGTTDEALVDQITAAQSESRAARRTA